MGCELLQANSGKLTMVRYRGNAPALAALGSGEIDLLFDVVNTAREAVSAGRVKAVASTNPRRGLGPFKDLPVVAETIPSLVLVTWHGVMAPKATPPSAIAALNKGLREALQAPDIKARMETLGFEVTGTSADEFNTILRNEADKYRRIVQAAGIQPE
jgi:tripartite-type tricarboxylate transporter receptor subunit TctC